MKELSILNLGDDLRAISALAESTKWSIVPKDDLVIWVTLAAEGTPADRYIARMEWETYPGDLPPSVVFVDEHGTTGVPSAWPRAAGFRPPNDICATWTAEGYKAHPEWLNDKSKRWVVSGNAALLAIRTLQLVLDTTYEGRFSG